jgi:hypothetical protein
MRGRCNWNVKRGSIGDCTIVTLYFGGPIGKSVGKRGKRNEGNVVN